MGLDELSRHCEDLMSESLESGLLKFREQAKSFEPVDQVVGKEERMEVGFIGEEVTGGDLAQGVVSLQLADEEFDPGAVIIKTPEIQRLEGEVGDQDLVMVLPLFEERQLFGGFFGLRSPDHYEPTRMGPSKRLVTELGHLHPLGGRGVTKMREFPFDRSGQLGDEDKEGLVGLYPFHELMVVKPFIGADQDGSDFFGDLGEASGQEILHPGGGMGITGPEFTVPKVLGDSFEAEERVIRGATSLERIITDAGPFLLSIEDQDGGIDVEDNAGRDTRTCRHAGQEPIVQSSQFGKGGGSQTQQEPPEGSRVGIGRKTRKVLEDTVVLKQLSGLQAFDTEHHGIQKGEQHLADAVVVVPLHPGDFFGNGRFETDTAQETVQQIDTPVMGQGVFTKRNGQTSGASWHGNESYPRGSFHSRNKKGRRTRKNGAMIAV